MKRVVAVLLVMVMAVGIASWAIAEDRQQKARDNMDEAYAVLQLLTTLYQLSPEKFDAEYCEITYRYFRLYAELMQVWGVEANWKVKTASESNIGTRTEMILNATEADSEYNLDLMILELWRKYRKQEFSTQQFMDIMVELVKSTKNK